MGESVPCISGTEGYDMGNDVVQAQVSIPANDDEELMTERFAFAAPLLAHAEARARPCP